MAETAVKTHLESEQTAEWGGYHFCPGYLYFIFNKHINLAIRCNFIQTYFGKTEVIVYLKWCNDIQKCIKSWLQGPVLYWLMHTLPYLLKYVTMSWGFIFLTRKAFFEKRNDVLLLTY